MLALQPPIVRQVLPQVVPKVDADGNEIAGVRSVLLEVPLGTYTGWNPLAGGFFKGHIQALGGGYIPFAKTKAQRLASGDIVIADEKADVKPGNAMKLGNIPIGTIVHNVEMKQGKGGQIARAAGTYVQLVGRDSGYAILRLNSGETRMVPADCMATVGAV